MELQKWEREDIKGKVEIVRMEGGDFDLIISPRKRYRSERKMTKQS